MVVGKGRRTALAAVGRSACRIAAVDDHFRPGREARRVIYTLEYSISPDTNAGIERARQQWVGLQGRWGSVTGGFQYAPGYLVGWRFDPLEGSGLIAPRAPLAIAGDYTISSGSRARWSNSVRYASPKMGGLTLHGIFANYDDETSDSPSADDRWGVGGMYSHGPVDVALVYHNVGAGRGTDDTREYYVAGSYDFGVVRVMGSWQRKDADDSAADEWPALDGGRLRAGEDPFGAGAAAVSAASPPIAVAPPRARGAIDCRRAVEYFVRRSLGRRPAPHQRSARFPRNHRSESERGSRVNISFGPIRRAYTGLKNYQTGSGKAPPVQGERLDGQAEGRSDPVALRRRAPPPAPGRRAPARHPPRPQRAGDSLCASGFQIALCLTAVKSTYLQEPFP